MEETEVIQQQIKVIGQSQNFILLIIVAVILSYHATDIQKRDLQAALCAPEYAVRNTDTFSINLISSVLVLIAVAFFYILSEQAFCNPEDSCIRRRSASFNNLASLLVLIAALIRLLNLLFIRFSLAAK